MQGVDLLGFAGDCTITAKVTMFGDRLTDFLNGQERFHIHKVIFESLDDGHLVAEDSVSITRDDLLAVIASGPRGSEQQRVELAETRMQLSIGPYLILGPGAHGARHRPGVRRDAARPDGAADGRDDRLFRGRATSSRATSAR